MKVLYPNLNFEEELTAPAAARSAKTQDVLADLAPLMGYMADSVDCVLQEGTSGCLALPACDYEIPYSSRADVAADDVTSFLPWGWSEPAVTCARKLGIASDCIPPVDSVRIVNSRRFHHQFDRIAELNQSETSSALFSHWCESIDEIETAIATFISQGHSQWIIKPQFSHAARNRLLGTSSRLTAQHRGWLRRRMGEGVAVEPWVKPHQQFGLQCDIRPQTGEGTVLEITGLLTDHVGRYLGTLLYPSCSPAPLPLSAVRHAISVCSAAASQGYFGPLGIDCFSWHAAEGRPRLRLCNDINGRLTMGRLAVALRRLIMPDEFAAWIHIHSPSFRQFLLAARESSGLSTNPDVRVISTSPERMSGRSVKIGSLLIAGYTLGAVQSAIAELQRLSIAITRPQ